LRYQGQVYSAVRVLTEENFLSANLTYCKVLMSDRISLYTRPTS